MEHLRIAWQGVAGRIPTVAEWERNEQEAKEAHEEALALRWSWLLPLAAGVFAYLSWRGHHGTLLPSLLIATAGAVLFLVFQVIAG